MYINNDNIFSLIAFDEGCRKVRKYDGNEFIVSIKGMSDENDMENIADEFRLHIQGMKDIKAYPIVSPYRNKADIYNGPLGFLVCNDRKTIEEIIGKLANRELFQIQTPEEYVPPKEAYLLSIRRRCPW